MRVMAAPFFFADHSSSVNNAFLLTSSSIKAANSKLPCHPVTVLIFSNTFLKEIPYYTKGDISNLEAIASGGGGWIYKGEHEDFELVLVRDIEGNGLFSQVAVKEFKWSKERHFEMCRKEIEILIKVSLVKHWGVMVLHLTPIHITLTGETPLQSSPLKTHSSIFILIYTITIYISSIRNIQTSFNSTEYSGMAWTPPSIWAM